MISIDNLRIDYGRFTAVEDLSLEIPKGSIFGLVGPNGAGKTSTIKVLSSLMEPTYGTVKICGFDVEKDAQEVRRNLGYMPDLAPVITNLKVWEMLDHYARSYGIDDPQKRSERIEHCLHQVKLTDSRNAYGKALSRGMTQRVILAKTLLHDPQVFLLDEPASGLDPMARLDLRDLLLSLGKQGKTVLISSHILSELSEMCTDVGLIHKGKLRNSGPVREVLATVDSRHRILSIGHLGDDDSLIEFLQQRSEIADPHAQEDGVEAIFTGGLEEQATLLRDLVQAGFQVDSFQPKKAGLEELMRKVSSES